MPNMRILNLLALAVCLAGCDTVAPEIGDLTLQVTGTRFTVGTEVEAVVSNQSDRTLYLYDCSGRILLHIEKQVGTEWENAGFVNNSCPFVPVVPYELGAGREERVTFTLGERSTVTEPGVYRLQTFFGTVPGPGTSVGRADWVESVSETFVVETQ